MKKFCFLVSALLLATAFIVPMTALAAKNDYTNYDIGTCKDNGGGLWQQLADGSWAPPDDSLNTCQGGIPQDWQSQSQYNPWQRSGVDYSFPYLQRTGNYPWGTNYPGGYQTSQDYFVNCVLAQSIIARPECQLFPRIGNITINPNIFSPNNNSIGIGTTIDGQFAGVQIPLSEKVGKIVKTVAMGWSLGQLLK